EPGAHRSPRNTASAHSRAERLGVVAKFIRSPFASNQGEEQGAPSAPASLATAPSQRSAIIRRAESDYKKPTDAASEAAARARWECVRFQSFPSSATVRSSPSGTKIGS